MQAIAAESPLKDQMLMVDDPETESDYLETPKGVVLPRSTRMGGIAGRNAQYPTMKLRTFKGKKLTMVSEESVNPSSRQDLPVPDEEDEEQDIQEEMERLAPKPGEAMDIKTMVQKELAIAMRDILRGTAPQPAAAVSPRAVEVREDEPTVEVTFKGSFGTVAVPYLRVISTDLVIVLAQDRQSPYRYQPPVSEDDEIQLSWKDGRETRHVAVKNFGLTFDYDEDTRLLVLMRDA